MILPSSKHSLLAKGLVPNIKKQQDAGHRITTNAWHELTTYHREHSYPTYQEQDFYRFFISELLPLVSAAPQGWTHGELRTPRRKRRGGHRDVCDGTHDRAKNSVMRSFEHEACSPATNQALTKRPHGSRRIRGQAIAARHHHQPQKDGGRLPPLPHPLPRLVGRLAAKVTTICRFDKTGLNGKLGLLSIPMR
jgi:hypothetical protein